MATSRTGDTTRQAQIPTGADQPAHDRDAGRAGGGIGQTLRDATYQKLADQKTRASNTLGSVAGAVRGMTEELRDGGQSRIADYVNKAAEGIDRWSDQLRERDIDDAVRAMYDFARRQPAVFIGLAFGAGALLARFLKSSAGDNHRSQSQAWSGRSDRRIGSDQSATRVGPSGVGVAPVAAPTDTAADETPRVSPDMPSARGVL